MQQLRPETGDSHSGLGDRRCIGDPSSGDEISHLLVERRAIGLLAGRQRGGAGGSQHRSFGFPLYRQVLLAGALNCVGQELGGDGRTVVGVTPNPKAPKII